MVPGQQGGVFTGGFDDGRLVRSRTGQAQAVQVHGSQLLEGREGHGIESTHRYKLLCFKDLEKAQFWSGFSSDA
ncbi:MAG: hypothetical protein R3F30_05035 [Planctomycetota bacterium]